MITAHKKKLAGWGNYPIEEANTYYPEKINDLQELLEQKKEKHYLARGLGRSYGDTALNQGFGVIMQDHFQQVLSFDPVTGILECEAGMSLEAILEQFIPQGFFLPVTPGTKFVTVGGAIANDVHGKNHHKDGCFSSFVLDLDLLLANGKIINCSQQHESELYWATMGGIGLTGIIVKARLKLIPIETSMIEMHVDKAQNLDKALELLSHGDDQYQYSVAWIDCLANGNSLGRCVLMRGNHTKKEQLPANIKQPLQIKKNMNWNVPFQFPSFVLNPLSIKLFNGTYYRSFADGVTKHVDYNSFFYPLDSIRNWNRAYGKKGFVQYQVVFPPETSQSGLTKLLERLSAERVSSFLAVLKRFGSANPAPLSFPMDGYTLALDIPIKNSGLFTLLDELDDIVLHHGGRLYFAKDSTMHARRIEIMYPRIDDFREIKKRVDPDHLFSSSMARRLKLVEE